MCMVYLFLKNCLGLHSDLSLGSLDNTISSQPSDSGIEEEFRRGMLSSVADDLVRIIMGLDAVHFKSMLEQTRQTCVDQESEMRHRQDRIMDLESKLSVCDVELQSALEERDRARDDASHGSLAHDDVVQSARKDRDLAVERRTKVEIELAKTRVELMQANGQLLESIQQKVELSQQLEQWQMDMQELIDEQMRAKLNDNRIRAANALNSQNVPKKTAANRLFSLFQR